MRRLFPALGLVLVAGCGGGSGDAIDLAAIGGVYSGTYGAGDDQGTIRMTVVRSGSDVTGSIIFSGATRFEAGTVTGTILGGHLQLVGTVYDGTTNIALDATSTGLRGVMNGTNGLPGGGIRLSPVSEAAPPFRGTYLVTSGTVSTFTATISGATVTPVSGTFPNGVSTTGFEAATAVVVGSDMAFAFTNDTSGAAFLLHRTGTGRYQVRGGMASAEGTLTVTAQ